MDDFRDETKTADPASRPSDSYAPADAAKEAVFSADDVYFMGKLPAGGESSFSNYFFNFSRSLRYFGLTGRYYFNLVLSYAVAAAGSYWMYRKATK